MYGRSIAAASPEPGHGGPAQPSERGSTDLLHQLAFALGPVRQRSAADLLAVVVPLRVGGRYQGLPFRAEGATDAPWSAEKAFTLGSGVVLGGGAARTDFSLERGSRGGVSDGLEESFWRFNFSVSVLGQ